MDTQCCNKCGGFPFLKEDHKIQTNMVTVPKWYDEEDKRNGAIPGYYEKEERQSVCHIYIVSCSECNHTVGHWENSKFDAIKNWNDANKFRPVTDKDRAKLYTYEELEELFYHNEIDGAMHSSWTPRHKVLKGTDTYGKFNFLPSKNERENEEPCWRVIGFKPTTVLNEWHDCGHII